MQLKQLYLKGFKSFANETVIHFNEDVIGIVGPNGSGKSNIVDAIRWVLGEQKGKDLRLETMSDVIFNGSKKQKKGSLAQVTITFENTKNIIPIEYNTISISRLLYRNGDSEYRLNDIPCRLKDIRSLLVDTGIGSNSYAIIALGMVDDILSDKNNARRRMFEQASGIIKYKTRKRETLLKLNSTLSDLERVEDLLSEIQSNMKSLEKQARRTKKYYKLKNQYKEMSIQHALHSTSAHFEKNKTLKDSIQSEKDKGLEAQTQLSTKEAALEERRRTLLQYEETLSEQQKKVNDLLDQIRDKEDQKNTLIRDKEFYQKENSSLLKRNDILTNTLVQINESIEVAKEWLRSSQIDKDRNDAGLQTLSAQVKDLESLHIERRADLDEFMTQRKSLEQVRFEIEKEAAVLQANMHSLLANLKRREAEASENKSYAEELRVKSRALDMDLKAMTIEIDRLTVEFDKEKERQSLFHTQKSDLQAHFVDLRRSFDAKQNEFELISSMVEKMEGSPASIQFLSEQEKWKQIPLFGDILDVEDEYRIALEGYLDPYVNHYVVDTLEKAYQGIRILGESQKGKAKFIVLEQITPSISKRPEKSNLIAARDLVKIDIKYSALMDLLLGDVYIMKLGERLSDQLEILDITILAQDGSTMKKGPMISGGSVGLFEGKRLGRKKQLENIKKALDEEGKTLKKMQEALENIEADIEKTTIDEISNQIKDKNEQRILLNQEKIGIDTSASNLESRQSSYLDLADESASKEMEYLEAKNSLRLQLDEIEQKIEALGMTIGSKDEGFKDLLQELTNLQNIYNEARLDALKFENKINEKRSDLQYNQQREEEISTELNSNIELIDRNKEKIVDGDSSLSHNEEELLNLYALRKSEADDLSTHEKSYYGSRDETKQIEDSIRSLNKKVNQSQYLVSQLNEERNNLKLELSSFKERLKVEFDVDLESLERGESEDIDFDALPAMVEKLRNRLQNYGEINPMAVEAYMEIEERYNAIREQRDDVLEAKESLLSTIKEIEIAATAKFMEAFEKVRLHFIDAFRSLFSEEDNCDLILVNPDDPLESDIEIVAKPKGKRPKSLSQLSGGEKTLTATALLFALYLLKPAPFCIFDEVDAPLDDANIEKFNKIIKRFSKESQFIVITHNKQTMAAVDVIYGVYMESLGISNLSQVDFRAYEHNEEVIYN